MSVYPSNSNKTVCTAYRESGATLLLHIIVWNDFPTYQGLWLNPLLSIAIDRELLLRAASLLSFLSTISYLDANSNALGLLVIGQSSEEDGGSIPG
jgi:hypothetical protein